MKYRIEKIKNEKKKKKELTFLKTIINYQKTQLTKKL